jgi:hypothetical protein
VVSWIAVDPLVRWLAVDHHLNRAEGAQRGAGLPARFGKYILAERLACGGMAEVFRAVLTAERVELLIDD